MNQTNGYYSGILINFLFEFINKSGGIGFSSIADIITLGSGYYGDIAGDVFDSALQGIQLLIAEGFIESYVWLIGAYQVGSSVDNCLVELKDTCVIRHPLRVRVETDAKQTLVLYDC